MPNPIHPACRLHLACSRLFFVLLALLLFGAGAPPAKAHPGNPTIMVMTVEGADKLRVKVETDLSLYLGSTEAYYEFPRLSGDEQAREAPALARRILHDMSVRGGSAVPLKLDRFAIASGDRNEFVGDASAGKRSTFEFIGPLPADKAPLRLELALGAMVDYPVAVTLSVPAKSFTRTRWIVSGTGESDPFDWANAPAARPSSAQSSSPAAADEGTWRQLPEYLCLGFRHIVPEGSDHILFVLGLFFFGVSWRKLITQTTVFTIAHATTLFLSVYGIVTLPPAYVEPAIALSIAFIAIENILQTRLGPGRLAVVFAFGLVHGLGFAASLSEVAFPKDDFLWALLGFNLGVDLGQLFIIGLVLSAVGWAARRPWYRSRIAIPASLVVAAIGLFWTVERVILYREVLF